MLACHHAGTGSKQYSLQAAVIYKSGQCNRFANEPAASWIKNDEELFIVYTRLRRDILGTGTAELPQVDFTKERLLLVDMGQKPTAGYSLETTSQIINVIDGTADLELKWSEPEPGSILTQVITSPCIMIKLPVDAYSLIRILDEDSNIMTELHIRE